MRRRPDGDVDAGWRAGVELGQAIGQGYWSQETIKAAVGSGDYVPKPGEHNVDPDEPPVPEERRFHGVRWSELIPRLVLSAEEAGDSAPREPPERDDDTYAEDWAEVLKRGEREAVTGTEAEEIGLFWAYDGAREIGTPPRLYNQHVLQIGKADGLSDDDEASWARLLALCNLAMADAGWVCWKSKWEHKVWRPIRAIRNVDRVELPPELEVVEGWLPYGSPRTNLAEAPSV